MKKILFATALSIFTTSSFAAEQTAVLKVKGTLTNAACTPQLSNGGVVDYGTVNLSDLSSTQTNQLGQKSIDLTITCTSPTKVSWAATDDRSGTEANIHVQNGDFNNGLIPGAASTSLYGVGKTLGGVNIGNYSVFNKLDSVIADGNSSDLIFLSPGTTNWALSSTGIVPEQREFTVADSGTLQPKAFMNATFPLATSLAIQDTTTLAITDDTALDGQLTINLRYL